VAGLPLVLAGPLLALLLQLPAEGIGTLTLALLLGTPTLSLIGAVAAALTLGARRSGLLMPLLVLPLYVPVLVFGAASVDAAVQGTSPATHLMLLGALLLAALALCPWLAGAALRQAVR
jgi:heme exporter protein B